MAQTTPINNESHTIDNGYTSSKWTLTYVITFGVALSLLLYPRFERLTDIQTYLCYGIAGALLLAHICILLVNPSYFYYADEGKKITLRNTSDYPIFRKYNEFVFPKSSLASYKINKELFGLKKVLSIKVEGVDPKTRMKKDYEIDKINISSISKNDFELLVKLLDKAQKK